MEAGMLLTFAQWHADALDVWEAKTKAEIAAMAESRRRGIGQMVRYARLRVKAVLEGEKQ